MCQTNQSRCVIHMVAVAACDARCSRLLGDLETRLDEWVHCPWVAKKPTSVLELNSIGRRRYFFMSHKQSFPIAFRLTALPGVTFDLAAMPKGYRRLL